jgi:two-component system, OmpR family, alkaline phosphatase synthesis response regulator PhoP
MRLVENTPQKTFGKLATVSPRQDIMTARRRTLVVEDESAIREVIRLHLDLAGLDVTELADGRRGLDVARTTRFDLIVLDVMLPGVDGITVCRALRADGANALTPILMVTARDTESDKVLGLESGADDYLTKPFGTRELVARVTALLRRQDRLTRTPDEPTRLVSRNGITLDLDKRHASVRGRAVDLTKQEFDLLQLLVTHPGIVFNREALLARVWGGDTYVTDRTVDTVVSRLRRKLEVDPQDPELILTSWGLGYKFVDVA